MEGKGLSVHKKYIMEGGKRGKGEGEHGCMGAWDEKWLSIED
jgi:hypothetical protein